MKINKLVCEFQEFAKVVEKGFSVDFNNQMWGHNLFKSFCFYVHKQWKYLKVKHQKNSEIINNKYYHIKSYPIILRVLEIRIHFHLKRKEKKVQRSKLSQNISIYEKFLIVIFFLLKSCFMICLHKLVLKEWIISIHNIK